MNRKIFTGFTIVAVLQIFALVGLYQIKQTPTIESNAINLEEIRATIQAALPSTPIRGVMPSPIAGIYEVTTKSNLLYTDETGRYLFVGGIYDPKANEDLVVKRKKELGFSNNDTTKQSKATAPSQPQRNGAGPFDIDLSTFDEIKDLAITYREIPGAPVVYEIFDPMCGHCRTNHAELEKLNVTLKKLLIVSVGSQSINEQVYCAINPVEAIDSLMSKNTIVTDGRSRAGCDTKDLTKISNWLQTHGIQAVTPQTIIPSQNAYYRGQASAATWTQRLGL